MTYGPQGTDSRPYGIKAWFWQNKALFCQNQALFLYVWVYGRVCGRAIIKSSVRPLTLRPYNALNGPPLRANKAIKGIFLASLGTLGAPLAWKQTRHTN